MWEYRHTDELYHYGVLGMKWGHRKKYKSTLANAKLAYQRRNSSIQKKYDIDMANMDKKDRKREHEARNRATKDLAKSKATYKDAKRQAKYKYKSDVAKMKSTYKNNYKQLKSNDDALDMLVFNSVTRKKAAKYMTENKMTMSEAKKKARGDAIRNTATALAVIGGMSLVQYGIEKFK